MHTLVNALITCGLVVLCAVGYFACSVVVLVIATIENPRWRDCDTPEPWWVAAFLGPVGLLMVFVCGIVTVIAGASASTAVKAIDVTAAFRTRRDASKEERDNLLRGSDRSG